MKSKEKVFGIGISILSFAIIGLTVCAYNLSKLINFKYFTNSDDYLFHTDKLGHFGDFIGGFLGTILTAIATYFVYKTYISQKEELISQKSELILQRNLISQQQFENTFFNMLNVHRELKNNLSTTDRIFWFTDDQIDHLTNNLISKENKIILFNEIVKERKKIGLDVFRNIRLDLNDLYNDEKIKKEINFYETSFLLKNNTYILDLKKKLGECNQRTISSTIEKILASENLDSEEKKMKANFKFIFETYQDVISHYCRNAYHILKYIRENEQGKTLGPDKKKYKNYANIFQSQLNVDEQFLLFYNFIHFNDETNDEMFQTINLVNYYSFLENIGIDNLIEKEHENYYNFLIKGSDRII
jgi:hypothetical protein